MSVTRELSTPIDAKKNRFPFCASVEEEGKSSARVFGFLGELRAPNGESRRHFPLTSFCSIDAGVGCETRKKVPLITIQY